MSNKSEEILIYLKSLKFKHSLFGLSRRDVLEKMRTLNALYKKQAAETQPLEQSPEYIAKIEALTKAFLATQEQADGILGSARVSAEKIEKEANERARLIEADAKEKVKIIQQQAAQELQEIERRKAEALQLLVEVKRWIDGIVSEDKAACPPPAFGGSDYVQMPK